MNNYKQPGNVLTLIAPVAVESGEAIIIGSALVVAQGKYAQGQEGEFRPTGVIELPKDNSDIGALEKLTWDESEGQFTTGAAAAGDLVGCAVAAAAAGTSATTVWALLTPGTGAVHSE